MVLGSDFDPYEELIVLKHNNRELIAAHQHHDHALAALNDHVNLLIKTTRALQAEIRILRQELAQIKTTKQS